MLGSDDLTNEDVEWFQERLCSEGINDHIFEQNKFVAEYIHELRRNVVEVEAELSAETDRLLNDTSQLKILIDKNVEVLRILGIKMETIESSSIKDLAELLMSCGVENPSVSDLSLALDQMSRKKVGIELKIKESDGLYHRSLDVSNRVVELKDKIAGAREEFDLWGKKDCELGIKELQDATETVLLKKTEYQERLNILNNRWSDIKEGLPRVSASILNGKLGEIVNKREELAKIEELLEPFNQLPPDLSLASIEVEEAKMRLAKLIEQRDNMLRSYR